MLLDLKKLKELLHLNLKGVIHIGAHYGEENKIYDDLNILNRIFFEPLKNNFEVLKKNVIGYPLYNIALGNYEGEIDMYVEEANNGQSSSVLKPKLHTLQYPNIVFNKKEIVAMDTLDNIIFDRSLFNFINIDVQGYELEVFKGAEETLKSIDYIMTEVNRAELYSGCVQIDTLDMYLGNRGFKNVVTSWDGQTWGDAFYVRT